MLLDLKQLIISYKKTGKFINWSIQIKDLVYLLIYWKIYIIVFEKAIDGLDILKVSDEALKLFVACSRELDWEKSLSTLGWNKNITACFRHQTVDFQYCLPSLAWMAKHHDRVIDGCILSSISGLDGKTPRQNHWWMYIIFHQWPGWQNTTTESLMDVYYLPLVAWMAKHHDRVIDGCMLI